MAGYAYALGDKAVSVFAVLPVRHREKLLRCFDQLARYPAQTGDYQEFGASGRAYEITLTDDVLITWWVDHATREVHIIRLERVD